MYVPHIIIGAGPAGLQMAYYLQYAGKDYVILERADHVTSFFSVFPRKRRLISVNKKHCGVNATPEFKLRFDWNSLLTESDNGDFRCTQYSDEYFPHTHELQSYMSDFADKYAITPHIHFGRSVTHITRSIRDANGTSHFIINTTNGVYTCNKLFIGAGLAPKPMPLYMHTLADKIDAQLYTYENVPLNPEVFKNKIVCIVGTGNAAFEVADYINQYAASIAMFGPSKVAWRKHYPGMLRSNNMSMLDTFFLKINNTLYTQPGNQYELTTQTNMHLHNDLMQWANRGKVDAIVYCGGFKFKTDIFDESISPTLLDNGFPALSPSYESTNVPNMYFIGSLMQGHDYKKGSSAFIHGFRYNIRYLARTLGLLELTPAMVVNDDAADKLLDHMITRINNSSCLSLRYEYFADCCVWRPDGTIAYFEDVPINYAASCGFERSWTIRLGFSRDFDWSFVQREYYLPKDGHLCAFLHPIIEYMAAGETYEFHIPESPIAQFVDEDAHILPLRMYWEFAVKNGGTDDTLGLRNAIENIHVRFSHERHPHIAKSMGISKPARCKCCNKKEVANADADANADASN